MRQCGVQVGGSVWIEWVTEWDRVGIIKGAKWSALGTDWGTA